MVLNARDCLRKKQMKKFNEIQKRTSLIMPCDNEEEIELKLDSIAGENFSRFSSPFNNSKLLMSELEVKSK
jgi:hypothetical protein